MAARYSIIAISYWPRLYASLPRRNRSHSSSLAPRTGATKESTARIALKNILLRMFPPRMSNRGIVIAGRILVNAHQIVFQILAEGLLFLLKCDRRQLSPCDVAISFWR